MSCFLCPPSIGPIYTPATYEMTAVLDRQADRSRWRGYSGNSHRSRCRSCTRIHRRISPHSLLTTGRCLCQTLWTSGRCGNWVHHGRHYLYTQTRVVCSWTTLTVLWTYCTRRSTISCCCVHASQTSAYSGRSVSADWAGRCQASSCLSSRWNRPYTLPTNGWRR